MSCYTDPTRIRPTDPGHIEGNPVFIFHDLINQNKEEVAMLKERYLAGTVGDVEVKERLYQAHLEYFHEARAKRNMYEQAPELVREILKSGAAKANAVAEKTLAEVQHTIGIKNAYSVKQ
jgi:tryptophanyl-tRNA synthetase